LITYALHEQLLEENTEIMIQSFVENIYMEEIFMRKQKIEWNLHLIYYFLIELIVNVVKRVE